MLNENLRDPLDPEVPGNDCFFEVASRIPNTIEVEIYEGGLIIVVGANENGPPHFHVFRNEKDLLAWKRGACLLFKGNSYYDHGDNCETLDSDELAAVVAHLQNKHPALGVSLWDYLHILWVDNNERDSVYENVTMPDYNVDTITRYSDTDICGLRESCATYNEYICDGVGECPNL